MRYGACGHRWCVCAGEGRGGGEGSISTDTTMRLPTYFGLCMLNHNIPEYNSQKYC